MYCFGIVCIIKSLLLFHFRNKIGRITTDSCSSYLPPPQRLNFNIDDSLIQAVKAAGAHIDEYSFILLTSFLFYVAFCVCFEWLAMLASIHVSRESPRSPWTVHFSSSKVCTIQYFLFVYFKTYYSFNDQTVINSRIWFIFVKRYIWYQKFRYQMKVWHLVLKLQYHIYQTKDKNCITIAINLQLFC